jgi:circadian clock protein KaiC
MMEVEVEKLGISGLDEMLSEGVPRGALIMFAGAPGTGKTTFVLQTASLYIKHGKKVVYVSAMTEPFSAVVRYASRFSFFNAEEFLSKTTSLDILSIARKEGTIEKAIDRVLEEIDVVQPSLVIFDPITVVREYVEGQNYRWILDEIFTRLRLTGATILMTGEVGDNSNSYKAEAYLVDAIIVLFIERNGIRAYRSLRIPKFRGVNHPLETMRYDITSNGIVVFPAQELGP